MVNRYNFLDFMICFKNINKNGRKPFFINNEDSEIKDEENQEAIPINIEQKGRDIIITSEMSHNDYQSLIKRVSNSNPKIKEQIDAEINEVLEIIENCDPFDLLTIISVKNCVYDIESYSESTHEGLEAYAEYALSLILSQPLTGKRQSPIDDEIDIFLTKIKRIFSNISLFFISESVTSEKSDEVYSLRFSSIMRSLHIRGDSVASHHIELINGLFTPHNSFLLKTIGFDCNKILSAILEIINQININLKQIIDILSKVSESQHKFLEYCKTNETEKNIQQLTAEYFSNRENLQQKEDLNQHLKNLDKNPFLINPNAELPIEILDFLSTTFGDNSHYIEGNSHRGWPTKGL